MRFLLIALVAVVCGCGQSTPNEARAPAADTATTEARSTDADVQEAQNVVDVVGLYKLGANLGVQCQLELMEDATFSFSFYGALGRHGSINGEYAREGNKVILDPTEPFNLTGFAKQATVLFPVQWVDTLYLIGEHQILGFCSRVQGGWTGREYGDRGGYYYLQVGAEQIEDGQLIRSQNLPKVPEEYRRYLTEEFTCQVLKIISPKTVLIDKGSADGVVVGSRIGIPDAAWLRVTAVREHESECVVWKVNGVTPKVGAQLVAVGV